jgi:hypothetical protein
MNKGAWVFNSQLLAMMHSKTDGLREDSPHKTSGIAKQVTAALVPARTGRHHCGTFS